MRSAHLHSDRLAFGTRRAARPWIEVLARAGYAAKGVLYLTIGVLATLLAVGDGDGRATGSEGALQTLGKQPFGEALLIVMAIGLAGHALWRFVQGTLDPEGEARSAKHPALKRASFFVRGFLHAGLVVFAVKTVVGEPTRQSSAQSTSAEVMAWQPYGVWLVGLAGAIIAAVGLAHLAKAWGREVGEKLSMRNLSHSTQSWIIRFGRFGTGARGAVFALIGAFVIHAAATANPSQAKGFGETLSWLRNQTFGDVALLVAAVGLIAYGIYQFVVARYRVIHAA